VTVVGGKELVMAVVETIVTVTVVGRSIGQDVEDVDREADEDVVVDEGGVVVRLVEEVLEDTRLGEEVLLVVAEDVDREADEDVVRDVESVVFWLVEELFDFARLVVERVVAWMTVSMQEQALRISEGDALQPELIGTGVAIAASTEDATTRSEFNAFRQLSSFQSAETLWARNERTPKRMMCMVEPPVAEVRAIVAKATARKWIMDKSTLLRYSTKTMP
jgi:hypothetical protein